MKRILTSLPFLFIFGLIIWTVNSIMTSMFAEGRILIDSSRFPDSLANVYVRMMILSFSVILYMILFRLFMYEREERLLRKAFNHSFPMCITDFKKNIIAANKSYCEAFGLPPSDIGKTKCHEISRCGACNTEQCPLVQVTNGKRELVCEYIMEEDGEQKYYDVKVKRVKNSFDEVIGILETFNDVTERVRLIRQNQKLIRELEDSLARVKLLSGMLPVCTSCKQVRLDEGYWEQIESYLGENSSVEIIPSLCPECKEIAESVEDGLDAPFDEVGSAGRDMQWLKIVA